VWSSPLLLTVIDPADERGPTSLGARPHRVVIRDG